MNLHFVLVTVIFLLLVPVNFIDSLWWAYGSPLMVMNPNRICRRTRRLRGKQKEICMHEPEIVSEVAKGAAMGTEECQFQFSDRRWNCSTARHSFRKILLQDIRETAFVNSMTAAGVTYAITQACSMGQLLQCTCDSSTPRHAPPDHPGEWQWGGCGDNIDFGYTKSKEFMDVKDKRKSDLKTLVNMHNNQAGRLSVKNFMRTECKCHGLSGSCTLKTCWRKMPIFREVGNLLKEKFNGAARVMAGNDGLSLIPAEGKTIKPPQEMDLIYSESSPDFCEAEKNTGSLGTHGRECNHTSIDVGGCDLLCCGRGYQKFQQTVRRNCKCRFHWCCEVECEICRSIETVYKCI